MFLCINVMRFLCHYLWDVLLKHSGTANLFLQMNAVQAFRMATTNWKKKNLFPLSGRFLTQRMHFISDWLLFETGLYFDRLPGALQKYNNSNVKIIPVVNISVYKKEESLKGPIRDYT